MKKPLILVTNDDGINAPGIKALIEVAQQVGDVLVIAPNSPQSGMGHAITLENPLRIHKVNVFGDHIEAYECSGTPVDGVKIAKHIIAKDRKIDLCVSGINHGSNASINVIYSGTMSAAMEASIEGIPSVGFSLNDYSYNADFEGAKYYAREILAFIIINGIPKGNLLNVNFPNLPLDQIKGMKVCRQAEATWKEEFQISKDPRGQEYFWLTGQFINNDDDQDTDLYAIKNGYVSIVPTHHDLTDHKAIPFLKVLEENS